MTISVEHKDATGNVTIKTFDLTRLAFIKHLGIAGQGYAPRPQKLLRTIGMLMHYGYYLQREPFYNNRLSLPPTILYDPTEKGQFSNLTGKAIADFLSKRIDKSIFTTNYEAAMKIKGMPIKKGRPDLISYTLNSTFALEAKGFSGNSFKMDKHKAQSQTGGIPVNFTVACVSYNLYKQLRCKYHDPFNANIQFDHPTLKELTKKYYSGLSEFINEKYFKYSEIEINGEIFYEVGLSSLNNKKFLLEEFPLSPFWFYEIFDFFRPRLILPRQILEYSKNGIPNDLKSFVFEDSGRNNIYIDNDRVGLKIE